MDGLLADTEPLWQEAEIAVFGKIGITLTHQMCRQIMGQRLDEVVRHWVNLFERNDINLKTTEHNIIEELLRLIDLRATLLPGVLEAFDLAEKEKIPFALASSSALRIIEHLLKKLGIRHRFKIVCSAEFEPFGKPHPAIFLTTAQKLGVEPQDCLVFEDSLNGVIAAKAARMTVVAIPEPGNFQNPKFAIADLVLPSLKAWNGVGLI